MNLFIYTVFSSEEMQISQSGRGVAASELPQGLAPHPTIALLAGKGSHRLWVVYFSVKLFLWQLRASYDCFVPTMGHLTRYLDSLALFTCSDLCVSCPEFNHGVNSSLHSLPPHCQGGAAGLDCACSPPMPIPPKPHWNSLNSAQVSWQSLRLDKSGTLKCHFYGSALSWEHVIPCNIWGEERGWKPQIIVVV